MFDNDKMPTIDDLIEKSKRNIKWREESISFASKGIDWLEAHKTIFDEKEPIVRFSFCDFDFVVSKSDCVAFLQSIKYSHSQLLPLDIKELKYWEEEKTGQGESKNKGMMFGIIPQ